MAEPVNFYFLSCFLCKLYNIMNSEMSIPIRSQINWISNLIYSSCICNSTIVSSFWKYLRLSKPGSFSTNPRFRPRITFLIVLGLNRCKEQSLALFGQRQSHLFFAILPTLFLQNLFFTLFKVKIIYLSIISLDTAGLTNGTFSLPA